VLQEALTNSARHGGGPVTIDLCFADSELRLLVRNALKHVAAPAGGRTGRGLIGMRERIVRLGGSLDAGPDGGEFRVVVWVPIGSEST
jgi:signal transduction histidine kinase